MFAGVVIALALSLTDCETDGGVAARTQEKSTVCAPLKTWQKKLIDAGAISQGFTPDMVYMAMGKPTTVETKELPEGHAEMWIYTHYYPNVDAIHGSTCQLYDRIGLSTTAGVDADGCRRLSQ